MICGVALGMAIEPHINGKQPLASPALLAILAATSMFAIWNIFLYKNACTQPDPEFPTSTFERFLPPVAASLSFFAGTAIVLLN